MTEENRNQADALGAWLMDHLSLTGKKNWAQCRKWVKDGARLDLRTPGAGNTVLHLLAIDCEKEERRQGAHKLAAIMIERGAAVDARNFPGRTPLIEAVWAGDADMVSLLLKSGADANAWSDLDYERSGPTNPLIELIKESMHFSPAVVRRIADDLLAHHALPGMMERKESAVKKLNSMTDLFMKESLADMFDQASARYFRELPALKDINAVTAPRFITKKH